jgi:malonyl-CoA O-methyltransferase
MEIEQTAMTDMLPVLYGRVMLDLACGTGRYGLIARERGAATVLASDNSWDMLKNAVLADTVCASMNALPLNSASVDVVICAMAIGHVQRLEGVMSEIARVLRPGGSALISDLHPAQALRGAQRTFQASDGRTYAVEHHVHAISFCERVFAAVGLATTARVEPTYDGQPVVVVWRLEKL